MLLFECTLDGGGGALVLSVTCNEFFAGQTVTCTDGVETLTQICPSSSPYIVTFKIPSAGIWTISATAGGVSGSTSIEIPSNVELTPPIPTGSTATPTDDIETWLNCANIWDKNYTTINEVLADASTLQALISSNNAADYMVRSTTWANSVTADSSAMTYIGLNDYCAELLLLESTWNSAICSSSYFESVLTTKVPTMTSDTTPSGVVSSNRGGTGNWKVFANQWAPDSTVIPSYIQYDFGFPVMLRLAKHLGAGNGGGTAMTFNMTASEDGSTWETVVSSYQRSHNTYVNTLMPISSNKKYRYVRVTCTSKGNGAQYTINGIQYYGRA